MSIRRLAVQIRRIRDAHKHAAALVGMLCGCMGTCVVLLLLTYFWGIVYTVSFLMQHVKAGCSWYAPGSLINFLAEVSGSLAILYAGHAVTREVPNDVTVGVVCIRWPEAVLSVQGRRKIECLQKKRFIVGRGAVKNGPSSLKSVQYITLNVCEILGFQNNHHMRH